MEERISRINRIGYPNRQLLRVQPITGVRAFMPPMMEAAILELDVYPTLSILNISHMTLSGLHAYLNPLILNDSLFKG